MAGRLVVMSAGPGRMAAETRLEGPMPRPPGFRVTQSFRETAEKVSHDLAAAMGVAV